MRAPDATDESVITEWLRITTLSPIVESTMRLPA